MPVYKDFRAFIVDDFFKIYIISKSDWWFSLDYYILLPDEIYMQFWVF